jgi:hypothetical protein
MCQLNNALGRYLTYKEIFMKKILFVGLMVASVSTFAQARGHWEYRGGGWGWVAPAVVGGVIGYELARPPVVAQPVIVGQPVIVQQPQVVTVPAQQCSPWTQIQNPDGSITSTRTCK